MSKRTCRACREIKEAREFYSRHAQCKACKCEENRLWRQNNPEAAKAIDARKYERNKSKIQLRRKQYYENNKERILAQCAKYRKANIERQRAYFKANRKRFSAAKNVWQKKKREEDPQFRLRHALRTRIAKRIRSGSPVQDLGCTVAELMARFESMFEPGMTWENYGAAWHVDHIRPLASFDLLDRTQFLQACHFSNLQPLWAQDNLQKGSKYVAQN